jgi:hypothetical protein
MASKEFVGPVDCYAALLPDEEYFLLMGRDPLMAGLTMIWASLRLGDLSAASNNFMRLCDPNLLQHYRNNPDQAKAEEAVSVAQRGAAWRERNLRAGVGGKPSWKHSRAVGVERFVMEYAERRPDDQGGVTVIPVPVENWPHWLVTGYKRPLVNVSYGGATDGRPRHVVIPDDNEDRQPPAETEGDCA